MLQDYLVVVVTENNLIISFTQFKNVKNHIAQQLTKFYFANIIFENINVDI